MQRKHYSPEFKQQIVKEALEVGNSSIVARKYDINNNMVGRWVRQSKNINGLNRTDSRVPQDHKDLLIENEQLKKLLGKKELENEILRDLFKKNKPTIEDKVSIAYKWISLGHSSSFVLRVIGLSRSTYYHRLRYKPKTRKSGSGRKNTRYSCTADGKPVCNEQIKEWLCELISGEGEAYGYKKLTYALRRNHGLIINKKKVYRLCKELDILRPQRKLKNKHPRRLARNRVITASNQLWETDLKYGYVSGEDRYFYVMSIIDVFDRSIIDYHIGLSCDGVDAARILKNSLFKRQQYGNVVIKPVIRSDNGPQYISNVFESTCLEFGIEHERIPFKTPNKNAHIESFHSIFEEECLSRYEFSSYAEAYKAVTDFMRHYNSRRIHSSLKYHTPDEFYSLLLQNQALPLGQVRV